VNLPTGVVTFVFSDIEGSTRLWESDSQGMGRSLARHDEIARTVVEQHGGVVFKHTGDGFGAAFASVSDGLAAAAQVAIALAEEPWTGPRITSRIGVHSGEAEPRDGDYFGPTVTRTARLMDAGNGGQIVVSESSRRLVGDRAPAGTAFIDAGEHRLKDLGEPIKISRLVGVGAEDERELRTLERAPHNLPIQLSRFIGREAQIKELADLLRQSRLTTLTGIGGVGKTRLALQVAAEVLETFDDGAWFVELAPLSEPGLLADTVADALSVPQDSTTSSERRLLKFLAKRQILLIMDNCEHLIDDVASFVDTVLRACPDVHVIATSREGLGVSGEILWRVPSLRVDDDAAAVELFAERARLVQPNFTISDDNIKAVAEICVRLDGIPLAIELATARLKMLSVEQIAQHLNDRFRLLTGGSRTAVERQRTLRAMMDWSYDLLSDSEKMLLRWLSVFSGGFTYDAAEEVCSGDVIPSFEVLDLLGRLVEASLVAFESDPRPRYRLLETVRQYAMDELVEAGETEAARLAHATFFRSASHAIEKALDGRDFARANLATEDLDNFRSAMTWAIESHNGEIALEIACNLRTYFWSRVMYRESVRWITTALHLVDDTATEFVPTAAAYALIDAGNLQDAHTIEEILPRVERLFASKIPESQRGELANALAAHAMSRNAREADELFRQAHHLLRTAGSPRWSRPVLNRSIAAWLMGSTEHEAEILGLVTEALAEGTNIHQGAVHAAFMVIGQKYREAIDFIHGHSPLDDWEEGMMLIFRAHSERALGAFDEAAASVHRASKIFSSDVHDGVQWESAMLRLHDEDIGGAIEAFELRYSEDGHIYSAYIRLLALDLWSIVAERRGDHESSALLAGHADAVLETASLGRLAADALTVEASRTTVESALGTETFEEFLRRGAAMTWKELTVVRDRAIVRHE
jgi:predicted ATPase/class 3 adenylate cyclase